MKGASFLFFLMLVQSQCEPKRWDVCDCLREEIELSYQNKAPHSVKMSMLLRYDELDCDKVAPLGGE